MSSNVDLIYGRLDTDAALVGSLVGGEWTGIAKGGVWNRKLKREEPGATASAWTTTTTGRNIRPSITILDRGDSAHPQRPSVPGAYRQEVWIHFYAPATAQGKTAIKDMRARVYRLLDFHYSGWTFASEDGPIVFTEYVDRYGVRDSEEFIEAIYDYQRFRLTSRHANIV